jgi:hypothetical protein
MQEFGRCQILVGKYRGLIAHAEPITIGHDVRYKVITSFAVDSKGKALTLIYDEDELAWGDLGAEDDDLFQAALKRFK